MMDDSRYNETIGAAANMSMSTSRAYGGYGAKPSTADANGSRYSM